MQHPDPCPCDAMLTLAMPAALEEEVLDFLLLHPAWAAGFSVLAAQGMGPGAAYPSSLEQVRGRGWRKLVLVAGVDADLRDAYGQYTNFAERLNIRPFPNSIPQPGDPFGLQNEQRTISDIRGAFPDYRIQFEALIGEDIPDLMRQAAGTPTEQQLLLNRLRDQMDAPGTRRIANIDPNAPIHLSDAQLLRLVSSPAHQLLLNMEIKDVGYSPALTRVLVKLTPFAYGQTSDGSTLSTPTIAYFGRSLEETARTLKILQTIMVALFLIGAGTAAGGAYLLFMAFTLWRSSFRRAEGEAAPVLPARSDAQAFRSGFLTNIANPKAAVFFGSVFSSVLPAHSGTGVKLGAFAVIVTLSVLWFALVAFGMSTVRLQSAYLRARRGIDRVAGSVMAGFGTLLLLERD